MYPPIHSKWDLVGYIGSSLVLENAVQRWGQPIGPICFFVYFDTSPNNKPAVFQLQVNSQAHPSKRNASLWKSTREPMKNVPATPWNPLMELGVIATWQYLQLDPIYYASITKTLTFTLVTLFGLAIKTSSHKVHKPLLLQSRLLIPMLEK